MLAIPQRKPQVVRRLALIGLPVVGIPLIGMAFGSEIRSAIASPFASRRVTAELVNVPGSRNGPVLAFDSLAGRSGELRARLLTETDVNSYPGLEARFGGIVRKPGIWSIPYRTDGAVFAFITLKPWTEKRGSFVNSYHIGWWPGERKLMPRNYENPAGFIEVSEQAAAAIRLSTHFMLRDFLTHDQDKVWPKYVVLQEALLDKLELVLATLEEQGVPTKNAVVLSGFRSPQYNARVAVEGAAYASRHQYGDAADIIVDADGDGRMDDLNKDGTVNLRDTDLINRAVERVERQYPELVGGLGLYQATGPRGPFAHIDVRGTRARWTNVVTRRKRVTETFEFSSGTTSKSASVGTCKAEGASAALCRH
jgi:hypothetical protein